MKIKYIELAKPDLINYHYHGTDDDQPCLNINLPMLDKVESVFCEIDLNSDIYQELKDRGLVIREVDDKEIQEVMMEGLFVVKTNQKVH